MNGCQVVKVLKRSWKSSLKGSTKDLKRFKKGKKLFAYINFKSLPHLPAVLRLPFFLLDFLLLSPGQEPASIGPDGVADEAVGEDQHQQGEEEIGQTATETGGRFPIL